MEVIRITEDTLKQIIAEELKKTEVSAMINDRIDSSLDSQDFKKKVKEISAEVVSNLFKTLWQQNNMWKRACQQ